MPSKRPSPSRSPDEATLSSSIKKKVKQSLFGRAELLDVPASMLVEQALTYLDKTGWASLPRFQLDAAQQKQLDRWLSEGDHPLDK